MYYSNINFLFTYQKEMRKGLSFLFKKIFFRLVFLIYLNIILIEGLEYKKNKNIKMTEKSPDSRLIELEDISFLENKINLKKSNFLLLYYTHSNKHW